MRARAKPSTDTGRTSEAPSSVSGAIFAGSCVITPHHRLTSPWPASHAASQRAASPPPSIARSPPAASRGPALGSPFRGCWSGHRGPGFPREGRVPRTARGSPGGYRRRKREDREREAGRRQLTEQGTCISAAEAPRLPRSRQSPVAPRIVRSECGLARRLAKEDRHLRISPRFFDRDETPAIFVTSLVSNQREVVRHVERKYYRRRRAAMALCCRQSAVSPRAHECPLATGPRRSKSLATQNDSATLRCGDRGIRVLRLGFFEPFENPEFLETAGLIRFGLNRNTPGK